METPPTDPLLTAESAAALLGISPSTIRGMWSSGRLERIKLGRLSRVRQSSVTALATKAAPTPLQQIEMSAAVMGRGFEFVLIPTNPENGEPLDPSMIENALRRALEPLGVLCVKNGHAGMRSRSWSGTTT